ncbi:LacI family DNA-binding transcriptional regulator [Bifidobacterium avesanii]|uniref:LacI family DNA-binding transcriptional regulator n=1 Tax=Bifidobacterium avesanii TaxID=1798157 RepID=A0A7K3THL5_9BIFI|nr:LacI family DNA-binding transcriptional regulator [Bifidobacterium avesanii]KAB8292051.1 transcriptional regulator, LacI family [Bifidobacterium avesanii]NEG78588.1 LacI family DNA-binding transcriptional regulator [Bifidobacterium avesanii]
MDSPTIGDVAKLAGVAISTVSRALNGGSVRATTRRNVLAAAESLGYHGDAVARSLASGRNHTLGIVIWNFSTYYTTEILSAITSTAHQAGYRTLLADAGDGRIPREAIVNEYARATDGMILVSPALDSLDSRSLSDPRTTVLINRSHQGYAAVVIDETAAMQQAVRHLTSLGHRSIAYLGGPQYSWSNGRRRAAFLDVCRQLGVRGEALGSYEPTHHGGHTAADALMPLLNDHAGERRVTAAIAFNDAIASGMLSRLIERGKRIPDDCSIIGVDDSLIARTSRPQLTSIATRQRDIGAAATRLLLHQLETVYATGRADRHARQDKAERATESNEPSTTTARPCLMIAGTLTVRGSTGPAA